jgi:hypothetical protein
MIFALCTKLCDNKRQRIISSKIFFCGGLNSIALQVLKAAFLMNVEAAYYPYILKFCVLVCEVNGAVMLSAAETSRE